MLSVFLKIIKLFYIFKIKYRISININWIFILMFIEIMIIFFNELNSLYILYQKLIEFIKFIYIYIFKIFIYLINYLFI